MMFRGEIKRNNMNTDIKKLSRIEKLEQQKLKLENRIQKEKSRYKEQERKSETRQKILLGALWLEKLRSEGGFDSIKNELNTFLTRNSDRALFNLPPLDSESAKL